MKPALLKIVTDRIVQTAHPVKVVLFGSQASGLARDDSDLDLLIIENDFKNKGLEMVRVRNAIGNVGIGVDVLIYSTQEVKEWGEIPGSVLYEALKKGKVLYESAS